MRNYLNQFKSKFFYVFVSILFLLSSCSQGDLSDIYGDEDNEYSNSSSFCRTKGDPEGRVGFRSDQECVPWALCYIKNNYDAYITGSMKVDAAIALVGEDYFSKKYTDRCRDGFTAGEFISAASKLEIGSYTSMWGTGSNVVTKLGGTLSDKHVLVVTKETDYYHLQFALSYNSQTSEIECLDMSSSSYHVPLSKVMGLVYK